MGEAGCSPGMDITIVSELYVSLCPIGSRHAQAWLILQELEPVPSCMLPMPQGIGNMAPTEQDRLAYMQRSGSNNSRRGPDGTAETSADR